MRKFKYADEKIGHTEIMIALPAMLLGVGILVLPKKLAAETMATDGWVSILAVGIVVIVISCGIAKFVSRFRESSFMDITTQLTGKAIAVVIMLLFGLVMLNVGSYQLRSLVNITEKYILAETPIEVIGLAFLLVVVYAVSGSRAALLRLNIMFFPFIIIIPLLVMLFALPDVEWGRVMPVFQTDFHGYIQGMKSSVLAFTGISILWFYIPHMREPERAPRAVAIGMSVATVLYITWFIFTLVTFGSGVTANLLYPSIELAKSVEIPGEFFERFELVFFVIWTMVLFNGMAMTLDITTLTLTSIFTSVSKRTIIYIVTPLMYFVSMLPRDIVELNRYGTYVGYAMLIYTCFVLVVLFVLSGIRKVK